MFLEICSIFMKRNHRIKPTILEIRPSVTKFYHYRSIGGLCSENWKPLLLKPLLLFLRKTACIGKGQATWIDEIYEPKKHTLGRSTWFPDPLYQHNMVQPPAAERTKLCNQQNCITYFLFLGGVKNIFLTLILKQSYEGNF